MSKRRILTTMAFLIAIPVFFILIGCQTNQLKAFAKVRPGMDKGQVLDVMGSPQATRRFKGNDEWTYKFYQDETQHTKEVHFENGVAVYAGDPPKPEVSAEETDKRNQDAELAALNEQTKKKEAAKKDYEDHEKKIKGSDEIRYAPEFKPIE